MKNNNLDETYADYWFQKAKLWMHIAAFSLSINGGVIGALIVALILR